MTINRKSESTVDIHWFLALQDRFALWLENLHYATGTSRIEASIISTLSFAVVAIPTPVIWHRQVT